MPGRRGKEIVLRKNVHVCFKLIVLVNNLIETLIKIQLS